MKIAIVGYATEGVVSADYWYKRGYEITVCDQNEHLDVPENYKKQLGSSYLTNLDRFDVIVRSAGIHPRILLKDNPYISLKITTNIEEFMRVCPSKNIVGVTGTKGKGTTSTLIAQMLIAAGKTCHLGGNIGVAALELLPKVKPEDYVVLELSSFQLEDFKGPSPHIAICLMVVPEHLNWHADMSEYETAKSKLFAYQTNGDLSIYFAENNISKQIANAGKGNPIPYFESPGAVVQNEYVEIDGQRLCAVSDIKLLGKHNWQNICAAVTCVWQIVQDVQAINSVLTSFSGLEHRLEFVREVNNVSYYDDSFATTPETTIAAIDAIGAPKILILGGSDKGIPLDPIAEKVANSNTRHVILIGNTSNPDFKTATPEIKAALEAEGINNITSLVKPGGCTMEEIVQAAKSAAQPGDVVLLSTGCASFDMFKDYKDRGDQFKTAVQSLA